MLGQVESLPEGNLSETKRDEQRSGRNTCPEPLGGLGLPNSLLLENGHDASLVVFTMTSVWDSAFRHRAAKIFGCLTSKSPDGITAGASIRAGVGSSG